MATPQTKCIRINGIDLWLTMGREQRGIMELENIHCRLGTTNAVSVDVRCSKNLSRKVSG